MRTPYIEASTRLRAIAAAVCGAALLGACGTGSETAGIDRGGVRVAVVAEGPITGFGSIIVNGVHYDVSRASVTIDGAAAASADLQLGQIVTVVGERDANGATGTADTVLFRTNVRGKVESVDLGAGELVVLRQRVVAGTGTVLDAGTAPAELASIHPGDVVAVSGLVGAGGSIAATRIGLSRRTDDAILGTVSNLDTARSRFQIGTLVVDYSAAQVIEGFPAGAPANGDRVAVQGSAVGVSGTLLAREIERSQPVAPQPGGEAEVEGLITRFVSPLDFDVSGRAITTTSTTTYQGGSAQTLSLDLKVHIEGTRDADGTIRARKIEIEDGGLEPGDD